MPIHDYQIDNQTGVQYRTDLNAALAAIVSNNSNATEPTTTFAFMWWADTTNGLLKMRNAGNNAWITLGKLAGPGGTNFVPVIEQGSTSNPGLTFNGDLNTGIYSPAADTIAVVVGGVEIIRFSTSGTIFKDTGAATLPIGTQAQRPSSPVNGMIRYNSDAGAYEGYSGGLWRPVGGGGGSFPVSWAESASDAPESLTENSIRVFKFASALSQKVYAQVQVPSSYVIGSQIKLRTIFYSPDSTGTALLQTVSTLRRAGTDLVSASSNQRTSSNSAVNLSAGTVNVYQTVILDLTDSSGNINGVAVSPGDLIVVRLTRGADTGISDLKVPVYSSEAIFQ